MISGIMCNLQLSKGGKKVHEVKKKEDIDEGDKGRGNLEDVQ